jgi:flagellar protein FlaI
MNYDKREMQLIRRELESYYQKKYGKEGKKKLRYHIQALSTPNVGKKGFLSNMFSSVNWKIGTPQLYNSIISTQRSRYQSEFSGTQMNVLDRYYLNKPFSEAIIVKESTGQIKYLVSEVPLSEVEKKQLNTIKELLTDELNVDFKKLGSSEKTVGYLKKEIQTVIKNYKLKVDASSFDKIAYYIIRDYVYFDKIDPLMKDTKIEDISCNGHGLPIFVWHQEYESIPTNVVFQTAEELDKFIVKLTYMTGRAISIAQPVVDASLPDQSRIQLTYEKEVTRRGSSFTIRKFRERPFTITDLTVFNTLSPEMAAYFWYAIERQASVLVVGGTASGKTVTINMLSMFIKPTAKIVSIEDTAELQLPHENWLPSVVRTGFGVSGKVSEISLYDLLKNAMRQRPEYIIVGEVRGAEAYTLVQAIATGHGGLATLHADSVEAAIHRLESEPMNIPRPLITTIDVVAVQSRVRLGDKSVRRIISVSEIVGVDPLTKDILTNEIFKWDPRTDSFVYTGRSYVLEKLVKRQGVAFDVAMKELENRKRLIQWMAKTQVRDYKDVVELIRSYYLDPAGVLEKIQKEAE